MMRSKQTLVTIMSQELVFKLNVSPTVNRSIGEPSIHFRVDEGKGNAWGSSTGSTKLKRLFKVIAKPMI
jgi:hypothetical protein